MIETILQAATGAYSLIIFLMLIDLVTGVANSFVHHTVLSSKRLKGSISKAITYFVVIVIATCCSAFGTEVVTTILIMYLVCVEGLSILENLQDIFPDSKVLGFVSEKLKILKEKNENKVNDL